MVLREVILPTYEPVNKAHQKKESRVSESGEALAISGKENQDFVKTELKFISYAGLDS